MAGEITGSTVPRRQLGRYLRDLRGQARLTVRAAAKELEWSEGKIWRIETGQTSMRGHDAELMCRIYGAPPDMTEALTALARETKSRGWWHSYGDVLPEGFEVYLGLEEAASTFSWYESELVPGLLQTDAYARTLIRRDNPGVDDVEIERRVQVRISRQALLTRVTSPPSMDVVVNEAILRRPVGGRKTMATQLQRLVEVSGLEHVGLRVMPFAAGEHAGIMSGPFVMLGFPENGDGRLSEPPTVYCESLTGELYLDRPPEVQRYRSAWSEIWGSALDEATSRDVITNAAREMDQ